ncbi:MAG: hypothetical protein NUV80_03815, partial [Candidatus Berkelbacteria bacterium]|nr:hypothetical protein [Candidatus Berkelbacteria bacterium]
KSTERNQRATHKQIKNAADRVGRIDQKVVGEYLDLKYGCMVKVLSGVQEVPYRSLPTGYSE